MGVLGSVGSGLAKRITPGIAGTAVREILERAIDGVGPLPGAAASGDAALRRTGGDTGWAVESLISRHMRLAAAQGFLTNLGGIVTMGVTMPTNIAAVALLQCHLAAAIAHLHGYPLADPAVRDAVLVCLLDDDERKSLAGSRRERGRLTPAAIAAGPPDADRSERISRSVTGQLLAGAGGKQLASFVARRIPVLGGAVGGVGDAWSTRRIGHDTARALPPRPRRPVTVLPDPPEELIG